MAHITTPNAHIITVNEKQKKSNTPKPLKYYFVISQVVFGFDYGFIPVLEKCLRAPVRCFVLLEISFYLLVFIAPIPSYYNEHSSWTPLAEYLMYICTLKYSKYTLYDYIVDVNNYIEIKCKDRHFFLLTSLMNFIIVHATKLFVMMAFRLIDPGPFFNQHFSMNFHWCHYFFYAFPRLGTDTVALCQIVIFYYAYAYVRNLKDQLMSPELDINRAAQSFVNLADVYDKIRPLQNRLVSNM